MIYVVMPRTWIRASVLIYLTALGLTSMPIAVGLLGWCPCGCLPDTLVYDDPQQPPGDDHDHDSQRCHGCHAVSYCLPTVDMPACEWLDAGPLAAESEPRLPPIHINPLLRPPRA